MYMDQHIAAKYFVLSVNLKTFDSELNSQVILIETEYRYFIMKVDNAYFSSY